MSLAIACPSEWKAISNSLEKRYDNARTDGMRVLERHGIEWFLNFFESTQDVCIYEYE